MRENFIKSLPPKFVRNTVGLCGELGGEWLRDLPQIIETLEKLWSLNVSAPFSNLSYNFVAPCVSASSGGEAVLKIALPLNNPEIFNEAAYLQITNGKGAVKLLNSDKTYRAILLERAKPGANLKQVFRADENKSANVAAGVLRKMLKTPPECSDFIQLEEWFNNFFRKAPQTEFPAAFLSKSHYFFDELNSAAKFLIHGDLHHENILSAEREPFLVIDPKGIIGCIGYEIAVFLNNHLWWLNDQLDLREKLNEAVRQFSDAFEISPLDLRKWAYAQIVLSAWWTFEENHENWKNELAFAEFWEV